MKRPPDTKIEEWLGIAFFSLVIVLGIVAIVAIILGY